MTPERAERAVPFSAGTFRFLRELASHNDRDWFTANKGRYESDVRDPSASFVRAVGERLPRVSRHLLADPRPVGGSIMRIYRDIRFSKDKSPYRTSVGIHFMHEATQTSDESLPGFFFHLAPGDSWIFSGMWRAEPSRLDRIRTRIADRPDEWKKVRAAVPKIGGESLKRAPPGYDPAHPLIDDIKRKGFTSGMSLKESTITRPGFPGAFVAACRKLDPLNRFLARAIGVPY
jgi:uncharacterized protein (TIGR02453 family)